MAAVLILGVIGHRPIASFMLEKRLLEHLVQSTYVPTNLKIFQVR